MACVAGIVISLCMMLFDFSRALDGNLRSWAYTFEWPAFGAFIVWIWRRLEGRARQEAKEHPPDEPAG